jgi:hypothetical protein
MRSLGLSVCRRGEDSCGTQNVNRVKKGEEEEEEENNEKEK